VTWEEGYAQLYSLTIALLRAEDYIEYQQDVGHRFVM
jgi:hypothetical protein